MLGLQGQGTGHVSFGNRPLLDQIMIGKLRKVLHWIALWI